MKLSHYLDEQSIIISHKLTNINEIIDMLLAATKNRHPTCPLVKFRDILYATKEAPQNFLGEGVYFPHARIEGLRDFVLCFGITPNGIPAPTPDGKPILFSILIICPFEKNTLMLKIRSAFIKLLSESLIREELLSAEDPDEVLKIIDKSEVTVEKELLVADLMKTDIVTISQHATLEEIVNTMFESGVDTIPVVDKDGKFLGVVSCYNILRIAIPEYMDAMKSLKFLKSSEPLLELFKKRKTIRASDIAGTKVFTVSPNTNIMEAAFIMVRNKVRYVYVLEGDKLVGILSRRDLIARIMVE